MMTGVAAILRYSLPGLDDVEEDEEGDEIDDIKIYEQGESSDEEKNEHESGKLSKFEEEALDHIMGSGPLETENEEESKQNF